MATDATGVPTSLGIPKVDPAVDAPSGLGTNAAMDSIDALLVARPAKPTGIVSGEAMVWNGASWDRSSVTKLNASNIANGIAASQLSGYPGTTTTFLRGDGTWAAAGYPAIGKITVSSLAGGPPASPSDGDIWIATGVGTNGERWQFQYNASAPTYKWVFIGGSPIAITSSAAIAAAGWVAVINFTATRAGIYCFDGGIQGNFAAAGVALQVGWGDNGVIQAGTGAGTTAGSGGTSLVGIPGPVTVAAGHNITLMANVGSSPTSPASSMRIVPVAVA